MLFTPTYKCPICDHFLFGSIVRQRELKCKNCNTALLSNYSIITKQSLILWGVLFAGALIAAAVFGDPWTTSVVLAIEAGGMGGFLLAAGYHKLRVSIIPKK